MFRLKAQSVFYVVIGLIGCVAVGELVLLWRARSGAVLAQKRLTEKVRDLRAAGGVEPFPSEANAVAIQAEAAEAERVLETLRAGLRGHGERAVALRRAEVPKAPTDAFFDIATFVERLRERARAEGVEVKADERFSFASYANAGPEREWIASVFRQRQALEYVLETLLAAKPKALLGVQREAPVAASVRAADDGTPKPSTTPAPVAGRDRGADIFVIDPRLSARVPGFVEAQAYRVSFVAQTGTLRSFLNTLARFELPLVVRAVEVEPAESGGAAHASAPEMDPVAAALMGGGAGAGGQVEVPKPLIEAVWSRFIVTIEWIDLVEAQPATTP